MIIYNEYWEVVMKRQVFFSFHFGNDIWRVGQIRNIGVVEGQEIFSDNGWEKVRLKKDSDIKDWIDKELNMRSCVVVLIGSETASRRWVRYEIEEAWKRGKGIVGIYINKLKNSQGEQSQKGANPLNQFCVDKTFNYIVQQSEPADENEINLGNVCTTFDSVYQDSDNVYTDIKENIVDLIEEAIKIRNKYPR